MKKIFYLLISISLTISVSAQDGDASKFNVSWGSPYKIPGKHYDMGYYGTQEDGFVQFSLKKKSRALHLQRFEGDNMKQTVEKSIDLTKLPKGSEYEFVGQIEGNVFLFYTLWDKPNKKENLYAQAIDLNTLAFSESPKKLIRSEKIKGVSIGSGVMSMKTVNKFDYYSSLDRTKLLITYELLGGKNSKKETGFYVFDKDLNKVWGDEMKMPPGTTLRIADDSKANVYMLQERGVEKGKGSTIELVRANAKSEKELPTIQIPLKSKNYFDITLSEDAIGNMVISGLYDNKKGFYWFEDIKSDGVFIVRIDPEGNVSDYKKGYYEFPKYLIKEFESKKSQKKADKDKDAGLSYLSMRKTIMMDDGSVLFLAEQYHSEKSMTWYGAECYVRIYEDIFAIKVDKDGELAWAKKIPKSQKGKNGRGTMSFSYMHANNADYIFYVDNIKNLKLKSSEQPAWAVDGSGGFLTVAKIDDKGVVTKGKLFDMREIKTKVWPTDFSTVGNKQMISRAVSKGKSKMMRITMN